MKYPMIEKLGLKPIMYTAVVYSETVDADDLERVLEKAQLVNCEINKEFWTRAKNPNATHTALLFCIEPIKKGVTKSEIRSMIAEDPEDDCRMITLLKRIEKEGIVD